jgi:hypothetical protein
MEMREGQEPLPPSLQSSTPPPEFLVKLYTLLITESPDIIEFIEGMTSSFCLPLHHRIAVQVAIRPAKRVSCVLKYENLLRTWSFFLQGAFILKIQLHFMAPSCRSTGRTTSKHCMGGHSCVACCMLLLISIPFSLRSFASFNRQLNYFRYLKLKKGMGRGRDTPCIYEHKGMVGKCLEDLLQLRRCTQRRRFRRPARCSSASPTNSNPEQLSGKWLEGGPLGQTLGLPLQSRVTGRCSSAPPQFLNQSLKCIASHDIVSGSTDTSESIYGISFEKPSSAVVRPDYDHFTSGDWSFGKDEPTAVSSTFGGTSSKDRNADAHEHSRMHSYAFEDAKDELNMAELELLFMNNSADQRDGSGGPDRNRHAGWRDTASNSGNSIFKSASFPRK